MSPELQQALARAKAHWEAMTPEAQAAMLHAQRESWVRAMGPCEHGDPDWETCPKCRGWSA